MTWSQAVAYKEISIALPPNARPGQLWRLLLSPSPSIQSTFVSLGNVRSTGKDPFSVISMPIRILPKPEKSPTKQTQIERTYHVSLNGLGDLYCLLREQTSFDLDKVSVFVSIWEASILTVLESLGQWDRIEFVVGGFTERFAVRNGTVGSRQSEGHAFVESW